MTDKERLEKLKQQKVWKDATGFVFLTVSLDDYKFLHEKAEHVFMYEDAAEKANAVIEQINEENIALRERVQELEETNKKNYWIAADFKFENLKLEQQNKRYREAREIIEQVYKENYVKDAYGYEDGYLDGLDTTMSIIDKSLEESE